MSWGCKIVLFKKIFLNRSQIHTNSRYAATSHSVRAKKARQVFALVHEGALVSITAPSGRHQEGSVAGFRQVNQHTSAGNESAVLLGHDTKAKTAHPWTQQ